MKARFKLTIIRDRAFNSSFGNMEYEISDEQVDDTWRRDEFRTSVPMSTYLIAFVVSNFKTISTKSTKQNILVEVAARPNAIDAGEGDFALE
jgi:aminopeptidase N